MLDGCSQGTFISEEILEKLEVAGKKTAITVKTLTGESTENAVVVNDLVVSAVNDLKGNSPKDIKLPNVYSRRNLPIERGDIPRQESMRAQVDTLGTHYEGIKPL